MRPEAERTSQVDSGTSVLDVSGARRRPLAEEGVHTVSVAPEGSQGQGGPPCLIPLVHLRLPLQQHLQGLSVSVVRLQRQRLFKNHFNIYYFESQLENQETDHNAESNLLELF